MPEDKNIFEAVASQLGSKKKEANPSKKKESPRKNPSPAATYKDPETQEMLQKIKEMGDDLKNKLDNIKSKTGPAAEHFKKLLSNEYILSPKEFDEIELAKKLLETKVWESVGKPSLDEKSQAPAPATDRKAKTLGARKKWIPMK